MRSRREILTREITSSVLLFFAVGIAGVWIVYSTIGLGSFNKQNAVTIFGSVIQGMSALLSVAIAVLVFRIQSLENRKQSLEQSTLSYVEQLTQGTGTYPAWTSAIEEDIREGNITNQYIGMMLTSEAHKKEERHLQQKRLVETLDLHTKISETIQGIKRGFINSVLFLIAPILSSLLMLMVVDALDSFWNFVYVSIVILMCGLGIALLTNIVVKSTVEISKRVEVENKKRGN